MAVIQVPLEIPTDIATGLSTGVYKRFGSVVRDTTTNKIIAHLKDAGAMNEGRNKVSKFIGNNKVALGVIGVLGLLAVGGSVMHHYSNKKTRSNNPIDSFTESFKKYIESAQSGKLNKQVISEFKEELTEFNLLLTNKNIELDDSFFESLNQLITLIYDYTMELAKANNYSGSIQKVDNDQVKSNLILLENYLNTQEEMFDAT
ncbi:hypothetical protein [Vagococcus lutrae]|uniref:hypothetical protein n=1 Tax=Vagococcus lutrae TaxID=81947 RepID=UPI0020106EED|nr:hypothetical protein [Vagococcus lutrae]MDT2826824.1 hypothetical protein [Vagococcus lutrae]UQF24339.1 hypothetical protein M2909_04950 [Vagococcus lutrae]UQF63570.1 hypothetical protein M2908_06765 [Vagococcus lutrae]